MQMRPLTFHLLLFPPPLHLMCAFSIPAVAWRSSLYCSLRSTAAAIKGLMGGLAAPARIQSGRDRLQPVVRQQLRNERWRDKGGEGRRWSEGGVGARRLVSARVVVCQPGTTFATSCVFGVTSCAVRLSVNEGARGRVDAQSSFPSSSPLRSAQTHTPKDTGIHYGFLFPAFPLIVTGL